MQHYKTIKELIKDYKQLPYPGIIYIEGEKKDNYQQAAFWVLSSNEKKNKILSKLSMEKSPNH